MYFRRRLLNLPFSGVGHDIAVVTVVGGARLPMVRKAADPCTPGSIEKYSLADAAKPDKAVVSLRPRGDDNVVRRTFRGAVARSLFTECPWSSLPVTFVARDFFRRITSRARLLPGLSLACSILPGPPLGVRGTIRRLWCLCVDTWRQCTVFWWATTTLAGLPASAALLMP